jgi:hypothetical protein
VRSRLTRLRVSPGVVLGGLALFFAIGGIGYAAATIGTSDLKNGAVTTKKLHKKAVTKKKVHKDAIVSKKVKDHSLKKKDLAFDVGGLSVAHANTANTANTANNALNLGGQPPSAFEPAHKQFTAALDEDQTKVVASSADFNVIAVCDEDASVFPDGTGFYIEEKSQNNAVAESDDDASDDFDIGDTIGFDFNHDSDQGAAINPNGHKVFVEGGVADDGGSAGFTHDCLFTGSVQFS